MVLRVFVMASCSPGRRGHRGCYSSRGGRPADRCTGRSGHRRYRVPRPAAPKRRAPPRHRVRRPPAMRQCSCVSCSLHPPHSSPDGLRFEGRPLSRGQWAPQERPTVRKRLAPARLRGRARGDGVAVRRRALRVRNAICCDGHRSGDSHNCECGEACDGLAPHRHSLRSTPGVAKAAPSVAAYITDHVMSEANLCRSGAFQLMYGRLPPDVPAPRAIARGAFF